jgi:outer membrane lipoprotein carrier protein
MFSFILLLVAMAAPHGATPDVKAAVHAIESRYSHVRTLKAVFLERYSDGTGASQSESGTVYFSRPGRMRWDYEAPQQKLFLVDGTNVWFYVPADRTASRTKLKQSSDWRTPIALLIGKADMSKLCRVIAVVDPAITTKAEDRPSQPGDTVLRCTPRMNSDDSVGSNESLQEVLFEMNPGAQLVRVVIREAGNVETEFRFGNWEENIPLREASFHFQPPLGVAVVDGAALAGAAR